MPRAISLPHGECGAGASPPGPTDASHVASANASASASASGVHGAKVKPVPEPNPSSPPKGLKSSTVSASPPTFATTGTAPHCREKEKEKEKERAGKQGA